MGGLIPVLLLVALVLFAVEAARTKSLTAAGLAFVAGAFLVDSGVAG